MEKTPTGMVRESKAGKLNFLSYISPLALERYAEHMKRGEEKHGRKNWQKGGYPEFEYLESAMRHLIAAWKEAEGFAVTEEDHLSAILFNIQALMHEQEKNPPHPYNAAEDGDM